MKKVIFLLAFALIAGAVYWMMWGKDLQEDKTEQMIMDNISSQLLAARVEDSSDPNNDSLTMLQAIESQYAYEVASVAPLEEGYIANVKATSVNLHEQLTELVQTNKDEIWTDQQVIDYILTALKETTPSEKQFELYAYETEGQLDVQLTDEFLDFLYGGLFSYYMDSLYENLSE